MIHLYDRSIELILSHQHPSGAYLASPSFADYAYCWFRDGSYTAFAMDLVGEHESARKFHDWAADTICRHKDAAKRAIEKRRESIHYNSEDFLHARYTLEGNIEEGEWPNFQLDGYGTWLWALGQHMQVENCTSLPASWRQAAEIVTDYLDALWPYSNYDCWEEFGDKKHTYTLGAIHAGLRSAGQFLNKDLQREQAITAIQKIIRSKCIKRGHLIKSVGMEKVDANLLGLCTPYRLFEPNDPVMKNTVDSIENRLRVNGGGVHRYDEDTYYGGGEWVLLTAWLGWYYTEVGLIEKAHQLLSWVEDQADEMGNLPEQVPKNLIDPSRLTYWVAKRGRIACPLLWSHAKYLILAHTLKYSR